MANVPDMTSNSVNTPQSDQQLRDRMVEDLIELGAARSPQVVAAFRRVPRHLAVPGKDPATAYGAQSHVVTKMDADGVDLSSLSAPRVQAMQIEQADLAPGMRVLEIGSDTPCR